MRLGEKQELFGRLYAEHLVWLTEQGYQFRLGDVFASVGHRKGSMHYLKLAGDINLFLDGKYLRTAEDHELSGRRWEMRHELTRWGGNWDKDEKAGEPGEDDGNHYSLTHRGRM